MSERALIKGSDGAVTGFKSPVMICTTDAIPGASLRETLGLVRGNSIRARHIGRDIMAAFRNIAGGEITDYTKMLAQSREQAIDRMVDQARALGANAVVGVRFTTSTVMQGAAEMVAYGTAVVMEPD